MSKIKASKQKGIFMGGRVPLGYRVTERKLIIDIEAAVTVRLIYRTYLETGNVRLLATKLRELGIRPRYERGDKVCDFSRGALYTLLSNPIYIGKIRHKGVLHDGQHERIIDQSLWDEVQTQLAANKTGIKSSGRKTEVALLMGKLSDGDGERLVSVHANKHGRRYNYYISHRLIKKAEGTGWRLPAKEIENIIARSIRQRLADPVALSIALKAIDRSDIDAPELINAAMVIAARATDTSLLQNALERASVSTDGLSLTVRLDHLTTSIKVSPDKPMLIDFYVSMQIRRRGIEMRLVVPGERSAQFRMDHTLMRTMSKAHVWYEQWSSAKINSLTGISEREGVSNSHTGDVIKLAFLSPKIVEMVMAGQQPAHVVTDHLLKADMPLRWTDQERLFGF